MLDRFLQQIENLVGNGTQYRYLLAVSGGADSCVMAHLFHQAGFRFAMAHCNFHLRGEDSNQDMQLVQALAQELNVPLYIQEFDTLALQKNSGLSIEMMARKLRYDWFATFEHEFDFIATAHQANDVAETLLLNICRGTTLRGLASIPAVNGKIIRPMLEFTAEEIRNYASIHQIAFAIDCTNADESIKRNRLRASVLPILRELNPNLLQTISRNCKIIQQQQRFYQNQIENVKKELVSADSDVIAVNRMLLDEMEDKELVLFEILNDYGFTAEVVKELCQNSIQSGRQFLSPTHTLLVNRDKYLIRINTTPSKDVLTIVSLDTLKKYFSVELCEQQTPIQFSKDNKTLFVPSSKLSFPLTLRHWQPGDYFYPLGCKGKQKLSDFFSNQKIDNFHKDNILLLCNDADILWIVGYRSDNRYKIETNTKQYYKITYNGTI